MPRSPFLQPTFLVTSTRRNITFGGCLPSAVGKPAGVRLPDPLRACVSASPKKTPDHLAVIRPPTAARLTARCRLRARRLPPWVALSRGAGRALLPCRPSNGSVEGNPLAPLSGRLARGLPEQPLPADWARSGRQHVNATDFPEPEVPSTKGDRASALARARHGAPPRWPAGQPPHAFIGVREHRLDLSAVHSRERSGGRVRSSGFCRSMFPRARLWTTRAPRPPGVRSGRLRARPSCLGRRQSPNGLQVRGRGTPLLGAPRGDCSSRRLRPNPDRLRAPPVAAISLSPCPERRGERRIPPSRGALAGQRRREGRATSSFREETRRSPARGTFHHEVVRKRTKALVYRQADRQARRRLFHCPETRAGDARTDPDSSANR